MVSDDEGADGGVVDFGLSEEQDMLRAATRGFLDAHSPLTVVRATMESELGSDPEVWRGGVEMGWVDLATGSGSDGGIGGGIVDLVVVSEELGRLVQPGPFLPNSVVGQAVTEFGTSEQLAAVRGGIATWCFVEPGGLWDGEGVALEAKPYGDGFELRGQKRYVQDAHLADWLLVTGRVDGALTQFLVEAASPGIEIVRLATLDITRRLFEVAFDGVQVSASAVVGDVGRAAGAIERQIQAAVILQCAESVGAAQQLLVMTVQYAKDRVQFGRAIGSFQAIKHKCANMATWVEASKAATYYAALTYQDRMEDAPSAASIAKSYVGDAFSGLAGEALQIHGGIGFTWEHDVHLYLRRAKSNEVLYGDPAWHRERICRLLAV